MTKFYSFLFVLIFFSHLSTVAQRRQVQRPTVADLKNNLRLPGGALFTGYTNNTRHNNIPGQNRIQSDCDFIVLTSQSQIDSFHILHPDCDTVGTLIINGLGASPAITNLNGLSSLTRVTQMFSVSHTLIVSLAAMVNLTQVDTLDLQNNPLLATTGISPISLAVINFIDLPALVDMENLTTHITSMENITIDSTALTTIHGLINIQHVTNGIAISRSPITSLNGLANLATMGGWLYLNQDFNLTSLGIHNLTQTNGYLFWDLPGLTSLEDISYHLTNTNISTFWMIHTGLTDLSGLDSITSAPNFYLWSDSNLTSLHGLNKLHGDINSGFSIHDDPLLTDISALSGITSINYGEGILEIDNDPLLVNLAGLGNITNIAGGLSITNNQQITSLNFLNNNLAILNDHNDKTLNIFNNPLLSVCSFPPVCNYLATGFTVAIYGNATGCGDSLQVAAACNIACSGPDSLTWNGNISNDWNDLNNWTPAGIPGTCTKVTIPSSGSVSYYPLAADSVYIGGLVMEEGAELDMNNFSLRVTKTLNLSTAYIYNGINIRAIRILSPNVYNTDIEGNFSLLDYSGGSSFIFNTIHGNTVLSDSIGRVENSNTYLNNFYGNLTFINNSDYGSNYLSNASPGNDYIQNDLTVINNSYASISVGLGGGNPIKISGNFIVNASNGSVDINNLTFVGNAYNHITQAGSLPITIENLFLQAGQPCVLDQNIYINNTLNFTPYEEGIVSDTNKLLILNNNCTVTGNSNVAFVKGPVKKIGNQAFTFPIGTIEQNTVWSAPLTITAPSLPTDEFTAQYFHHSPNNDGYDTSLYSPGFGGISGREYWKLTRDSGTSKVKVTLPYDSARSGPAFLYQYLQVAGWNGNLWRSWGTGGFTGYIFGGTLISGDSLSAFGPLAFSFKPVRKPIITMGNLDTVHCLNTGFYVPYTADTAMIAGNNFRIEVSDTLGNFSNTFNYSVGSKVTSAASDSIPLLAYFLLPNKNYKIRIVGNLPPDTSTNTKTIRFITAPQLAFSISGANPACLGAGVQKYYPAFHEPGANYTWTLSGGGSFTTNGDTAFVTWNTTGTYTLTCNSSNQCGNGPQQTLSVVVNPPAPTLTASINNTGRWLYASQAPATAGYQWYKNGTLIPGAVNSSYYASLAGNYTVTFSNYCGNGPVSNTISFGANSIAQTINFPALPNKTYGDAPFIPAATATSGLPVSFSIVSGPAIINSQTNVLTITGTGLVTVKASQVGNNVYDTAASVINSFTVSKAVQLITFPTIPSQDIGNATVTLMATASSALPVTYSIVSGFATVSGTTVFLTGVGTMTVRAYQAGDTNYLPAVNVDKSFCTSVANLNPVSGYTNLCPGTATYTVNNIPGATYFWRIAGGGTISSVTNSANVTWATPGIYNLLVSATGNCGSASANDTLVVNVINSIQPDSVQSMLPANNAINQQLPLTLSWVPAHPNNFYTFDLYVWRADLSQPAIPYAANLTSVNYTLPVSSGLLSNHAYKWMVVSHNGSCTQINTGPVQQFTLIPLPDLTVQNVQAPATAFSGQTVSINWTVKNNGPGNTTTNQNWTDAVFMSFDTIPNFSIPPNTNPPAWSQLSFPIRPLLIGTRQNVSALDSGQQYTNSINFTLPLNYSQPLYVYVIANYPAGGNAPQQVTIANDTARAPQPIIVTLSPTPDLRVDTVFTPSTTFSGSTINVTYKVKNYGALTPSGSVWTDKVYISQSPFFNTSTAIPVEFPKPNGTYYANSQDAAAVIQSQLPADSTYIINLPVVIPNYIFGTYFIYVFTNATGTLYEGALSNNNTNRSQLQVFLTPTPHLTVSSLTLPVTTASTTQPIGVNWNILNTGFNDNIEKNKGHYIVPRGTCVLYSYCYDPATGNTYVCGSTPGINYGDSLGFGSSYWLDRVYLSTDSSGLNTANALLVNETAQGILNYGLNVSDNLQTFACNYGGGLNINTFNVIKTGSNHPKSGNFVLPDNLQPGNYYVYVLTNSTNTVYQYPGLPETRRSVLPITVQRPDAVVSSVSVPANTTGGQSFAINYSISNNGPGAVFNHIRNDNIYVSTSAVLDGSAQLISTQTYTEDLPVGVAVPHTLNYTFPPSTSGTRYFYVYTNFDSSFRETNPNNNVSNAAATTVSTAIANDLTVSSVQLADTLSTIFSTYFKYSVANSGGGTTAGAWRDSIFISCSPTFNPATSYFLTYRNHNEIISGGGHYTDSFYVNIPYTFNINNCFPPTVNSTAYYFVKTNADNIVYEGSNGNNNVTGSGARPTVNPLVDHIVTVVTGPDTATVARPYLTNWTVKNIGYNPGTTYYSGWYDGVYFSPDSIFSSNAVAASYYPENSVLNTNQTYSESKNTIPPNIPTGDYYVLVKTNYNNAIAGEKVTANNTNVIRDGFGAAKKIHVILPLLPDLTDSIFSSPAIVATGQPVTIIHRATNNGAGVTYPSNWSDDIWLSSDFIPGNAGDIQLSAKNHVGALQPGQYYNDTSTATIGLNVAPGNYVLISRVNATGNVFESNSTNNLAFKYITVYRPAPSDLVVENIMKPDSVFLGYTVDTAKWVIHNIAPNAAVGVSSDGIYLSHSNILDSTAVLLGIKNKTINMGPLSRDTVTLQPLVTNVTEGNYNVIVKTDLLNNIYESDKTNNTGISATPIYVGVKQLPLNVLTANTLYNIPRFYKLVIPDSLSGATILVSLKSNDSLSMINQLFIGQGYIPSAAQFDYTYNTPNYGNQDIVMTSVTAGVYYITARNVSAAPLVQNITLKAVKLPFTILNVQASSGGNIGNVTIKISGSLFSNNMAATLTKSGTTITASSVYFSNSTIVYATFNLQGRPLGIYDVTLTKPDTTIAVLANGFSIVTANNGGLNNGGGVNTGAGDGTSPGCDPGAAGGINSQLVTELIVPDKVFGGWVFVIQVNYNNPTNTDVPAQTRMLFSVDGLPVALSQQDLGTAGTSLYLQLTEQDGPPGIIRAGGSGTITIYSRAPVTYPAHKHAHFILR